MGQGNSSGANDTGEVFLMDSAGPMKHVVIVGGGFAGVGCAVDLVRRPAQLPPVPTSFLSARYLPTAARRRRILAA